MKALLLAAGFGTRLLPITEKIPKCLVKVNEISMLEFWLRKLEIIEVSKVVVNTHHFSELVSNEISVINVARRVQIFHEEELLGTAGTLLANLEPTLDSDLLVLHCDNYSEIDLLDFIRMHSQRNRECVITMAIFETDNVQMSGMIETDETNIVCNFIEKPMYSELTMANAAIYIFDKQALKEIRKKHVDALDIARDILPNFIGRIQAYSIKGFHMDMGTPENLEIIRKKLE
jgi:mannose-1-phosphate guanylyltransferase